MKPDFVYLASASPRRRQLLGQLGLAVRTCPQELDETPRTGERPADYVRRLAAAKARAAIAAGLPRPAPVIAADTAVVADEELLGKPAGRDEARAMLSRLSGRQHEVYTAVAVAAGQACEVALSCSRVHFRPLRPAEIDAYWDTGEPRDKAGGYAIQGLGAVFVRALDGSYSGVMGLPLCETAELLGRFGWPLLEPDS
ncbi:MAG: septum formation inhibitor Maf [Gammaproteobacteria bacterium]|nr:MAG: septum formation inhibitor Maf [Gammaproteobacteria bacterium]